LKLRKELGLAFVAKFEMKLHFSGLHYVTGVILTLQEGAFPEFVGVSIFTIVTMVYYGSLGAFDITDIT